MDTPLGGINLRAFIPGVIMAAAVFFVSIFFYLNSGEKKISIKMFLVYSLTTILLFALIGTTGFVRVERFQKFLLVTNVGMLMLGILHAWCIRFLSGEEDNSRFLNELIFTIYILLLGGFIYLVVFLWKD